MKPISKNTMLNIILFGPPGAGKGTQSEKLITKYQLTHLSTGDVFRYNIKNETPLGVTAQDYISKGALVPDELTIAMVQDFLERNKNDHGFILDGFPRTINQAEALDKIFSEMNLSLHSMIALEVPEEELITRLLERGKTSGRADDQDEQTIRNRFNEYESKTRPVAEYYAAQQKFIGINGVGSMDEIFDRICAVTENK